MHLFQDMKDLSESFQKLIEFQIYASVQMQ